MEVRLRTRLLAFSAAQLVVFGIVVAASYHEVQHTVLPMLEESLRQKTESALSELMSELDLALAADDVSLIAKAVGPRSSDPDFRFIEVLDAKGTERYRLGEPIEGELRAGAARVVHQHGANLLAWSPIEIEHVAVGSVVIAYERTRIDHFAARIRVAAGLALLAWLAILVYSVVFANAFVRPIRAMVEFTRGVASGTFGRRLAPAPGELDALSRDLNHMSTELAAREEEQRRAARKEAELRQELMSVSRMAGMAEVATGVLHNVGNVLNSLNVSVSVVGDRLKQSKIASLTRTIELFEQHPEGLVGFLSTEKGKLIPQFLTSVSQRLVEENALFRRELESVAQNVDHIKAIVATQQSYSLVAGVAEPVELGSLMDDALHLSEASFTRHRIELVREFGAVPTLNTDRHKLLQIAINLISNARHALKAKGPAGQLVIAIERRDATIAIIVRDTGVGITAENLPRVFQHGFTTKKGGHGFGLHSCANAARELGGSISVESAGAGQGATFTLIIPVEPPARKHDLRN